MSHSYLIYGDIEKIYNEVLLFSKLLNCTDEINLKKSYINSSVLIENIDYKCDCRNCKLFDFGTYPEIYEINFNKDEKKIDEAIRKIKIDHIRDLFSNIIEKPVMGKYKIFNIKYVENMNVNTQNALLKILEEPPKYVIILLMAKDIDLLLPTIKSRCTKLYIFEKEDEFCENLKEDFEGKIIL